MATYISAQKIRELVSMGDVINVVEDGLKAFSSGQVVQPVRSVVEVTEHNGFLGVMPSYCNTKNCLATKLVTFYNNNNEKGLPSHQAIVIQLDPTTGSVLALIDGVTVTNMRTAAASAVALKYIQLSTAPRILVIVGCGEQARSHAEAIQVIHQFDEVRIWGRNKERALLCAADIGRSNVKVCDNLQTACKDADVIVTVTMATEPVVKGEWLKDGAVILAVGACRPDWRELDDGVMKNAIVIADSREAAAKEAGDILLSKVDIYSEVGQLVAKGPVTMETMRLLGKRFVVFKSLGIAIEDAVTGKLIYDRYNKI